jgi:site-specific DNA-methyltransferase (adenine-specific)
MPENSVDSIVTDPPYELSFMGRKWDGSGIAYSVEMWAEAMRVLKPGGHLLAFGGTRTYHRMACAIEDAGFEIRDSIHWVYGSGFPKSLNIGKAIDKRGGAVAGFEDFRDAVKDAMKANGVSRSALQDALGNFMLSHYLTAGSQPAVPNWRDYQIIRDTVGLGDKYDDLFRPEAEREVVGTKDSTLLAVAPGEGRERPGVSLDVTLAATDEAKRWEGWGTALKPAHEPIVVARKPLAGTVAGNVLVWGTGGLNIDGCRVHGSPVQSAAANRFVYNPGGEVDDGYVKGTGREYQASGRWPANVVFDRTAGEALDQQSGVSRDGVTVLGKQQPYDATSYMISDNRTGTRGYGGEGGASRFFTQADFGPDDWPFVYQAKPSRKERNAGLDGLPEKPPAFGNDSGDGLGRGISNTRQDEPRANHHPTVKPVALMRHLVRLVTPPGGTVLDPFAGSGTTLVAAILEGMVPLGCEMTDEYLPIIEGRMAWAHEQVADARDAETNPAQPTLL